MPGLQPQLDTCKSIQAAQHFLSPLAPAAAAAGWATSPQNRAATPRKSGSSGGSTSHSVAFCAAETPGWHDGSGRITRSPQAGPISEVKGRNWNCSRRGVSAAIGSYESPKAYQKGPTKATGVWHMFMMLKATIVARFLATSNKKLLVSVRHLATSSFLLLVVIFFLFSAPIHVVARRPALCTLLRGGGQQRPTNMFGEAINLASLLDTPRCGSRRYLGNIALHASEE